MRRSPALAPLSREHHEALGVALTLRRATDDDLPAAVERFRAFFAVHGAEHFAEEEAVLVPELPAPMARRLLDEHDDLRRRGRGLEVRPTVATARALGEALAAHVRFEEREVFPHLERELSPERLALVGRRLAQPPAAPAARPRAPAASAPAEAASS